MQTLITDFLDPGELADGDLRLLLAARVPADRAKGYVPAYEFAMTEGASGAPVGRIALRLGASDFLVRYAGQIGYGVDEPYRGRHYAARSCRLLVPLARAHSFEELWITCNPDNLASRRTCELAGAELVEIVALPEDCDMYERGERFKCRYRLRW
jgi:tagatose 1,6-diphosphate aldolase